MLLVSFLMVKNLLILLFDYQNYKDNMELIISIIMLLATVGAIFLAWRNLKKIQEQIELQKQESEQNAIARAWEIVGRKVSGNSGKIEALEFLNKRGTPLIGIDLSAKTHGGSVWLRGVDLSGANLSDTNLLEAILFDANLSHANLFRANLSHANLFRANLSHANLSQADLCGATLYLALLDAADFRQSTIDKTTNFGGVVLKDKNKLPMFSQNQIDELGITMKVIGLGQSSYHALKITLNPPKPSKPV